MIVRGADTSRLDLAPECDGLYAISIGLSANFPDDHEMLKHGLIIYDALYAWCRKWRPRRRKEGREREDACSEEMTEKNAGRELNRKTTAKQELPPCCANV